MVRQEISVALSAKLGPAATSGLADLLESERVAWTDDVMTLAVDRFERRLTEQVSGLRVDLVREIQESRVETIRWSFGLWTANVTIIAGLVVALWRLTAH